MEKNNINWFPGHMARAISEIEKTVKDIDLIIEVIDARATSSSSNEELSRFNKPILKIALKSDLADLKTVKTNEDILFVNTIDKSLRNKVINSIEIKLSEKKQKLISKGLKNPIFYIMVVGLPNVGKSSLINFLANKNRIVAKNQPGVTRNQNTVKLSDSLYLQDNPGILFKKIKDLNTGYKLALINTIKKDILPLYDVVKYGYEFLNQNYQNQLFKYYGFNNEMSFEQFIDFIGNKKMFISIDNKIDLTRVVDSLFKDFTDCKVSKINYDR